MNDDVGHDEDRRPWPGGGAPLLVRARQLGWLCWTERRLFDLTGGWATSMEEPAAVTLMAVCSRHHGERGEWWFARLPELRELPADTLVLPPGGPLAAVCGDLAEADALGDAERVAVLGDVLLPRLLVTYEELEAQCDDMADAPVRRTIRRARVDLADDAAAVGGALRRLVPGGAGGAAAGAAVEAVQRRFGGVSGLVPLAPDLGG